MTDTRINALRLQVVYWDRELPHHIARDWEALLELIPDPPLAFFPDWWVAVRAHTLRRPWPILVVRQLDRPIFLAPFQAYSPWYWKVPNLFAPDQAPILIDPRYEALAWEGVARWLAETRRFHMLSFTRGMDARRPELAAAACRRYGVVAVSEPSFPILITPLAATWEDFLAGMEAKMRADVRYAERLFTRDYPQAVVSFADTRAAVAIAMEALITLHRRRWAGQDTGHSFEKPGRAEIYAELFTHFWARDMACIGTISLDGRVIAAATGLHAPGQETAYYHYVARDVEAVPSRYAPGIVLLAHLTRRMIARGARRLHLGNGESMYKFNYGAVAHPQWLLSLANSRLASVLAPRLDQACRWLPWLSHG